MKWKFNNPYFKWGVTAFLVVAASLLFYYVIFHIDSLVNNIKGISVVFSPVLVGFIIAYLLTPVLNQIEQHLLHPFCNLVHIKPGEKRSKAIRAIGIIITICLVFFIIYMLISMLVSQIVPSIQRLVNNFDLYVDNLLFNLNKLLEDNVELKNYILPRVDDFTHEIEGWLADTAGLMDKAFGVFKTLSLSIISIIRNFWNFLIGLIISIYVLASKESFSSKGKKMVYALLDTESGNSVLKGMRFVHKTFIGFLSGKVLDSIIIGLLCFIGTTLLNTPYAALVSVIVGVTNIIPFFGPYLGAIPSALLILLVDLAHPLHCLYFIIFIIVLQQFDGNILGPKILGNSTGLSGFCVIFAITVFGGLFGILGMIVGVPIFAVIYAGIKHFINIRLRKKQMPEDSGAYFILESVDKNDKHMILSDMPLPEQNTFKKPGFLQKKANTKQKEK